MTLLTVTCYCVVYIRQQAGWLDVQSANALILIVSNWLLIFIHSQSFNRQFLCLSNYVSNQTRSSVIIQTTSTSSPNLFLQLQLHSETEPCSPTTCASTCPDTVIVPVTVSRKRSYADGQMVPPMEQQEDQDPFGLDEFFSSMRSGAPNCKLQKLDPPQSFVHEHELTRLEALWEQTGHCGQSCHRQLSSGTETVSVEAPRDWPPDTCTIVRRRTLAVSKVA